MDLKGLRMRKSMHSGLFKKYFGLSFSWIPFWGDPIYVALMEQ